MRLAAFIGLKDEAGLIGACIEQLKRVGADVVIVLDHGSQDGSREVVERLAIGDPTICLSELGFDLSRDGSTFRSALQEFDPDWMLFADADEFWLPRNGTLKQLPELAQTDVLVVKRFNVPLTVPPLDIEDYLPSRSGELPLIAERESLSRESMKSDPAQRWVMHAVGPKVMCRASTFGGLEIGAHRIAARNGQELRKTAAKDVIIAHVPFTSFERFERKVENIRGVLDGNDAQFDGTRAWHWRRWLELADQKMLRPEFELQQMGACEINRYVTAGVIRTAADLWRR